MGKSILNQMDYLITAYEYYRPGGVIMVTLAVLSVWMWTLIIERILFFRKMDTHDTNINEAINMIARRQPAQPRPGLCYVIVSEYLRMHSQDTTLNRRILDQLVLKKRPKMSRFLQTITILAATAPLLGLLGTVTGIITTFDAITLFGTGNAKALAGGISKALITTQCGLLVGIPGLFMGSFLTRRSHSIEQRLTETVMALKRAIEKQPRNLPKPGMTDLIGQTAR